MSISKTGIVTTIELTEYSLPPEYQQVEYIESNGTQYIDTGIIPSLDIGYDITVIHNSVNSTDNIVLGSRYGDNRFWIDFDNSGGSKRVIYIGYGIYNQVATYTIGTVYRIQFNINSDKVGKINNTDFTLTATYNSDNALSMYLFKANYSTGLGGNFKVFKCILTDKANPVRYFIPCYRKTDNEIGMYDLITKTFFTNSGTGTFTKGNDVKNLRIYNNKILTNEIIEI